MGGNMQTGYGRRDFYIEHIASMCGVNSTDKKYMEMVKKLTIAEMRYLIRLIEEAQARAIDEINFD